MSNREAAAAITAEREAFEEWADETTMLCIHGNDGDYVFRDARHAWAAWQARARLSAPVAAQPAASGVDAQMVDRPLWERDLIESDRRRDAEQSKPSLTGAQPAPAAPNDKDAEHAAWLADKIVAHGDYAKEAAAMLLRWPAPAAQPADSAMLDWLEEHCTGASDSERYLPFRLYWGKKGHGKSLREVIHNAMKDKP